MSFARFVAGRYLFSKKNTNMINVITGVSVTGLAFGTAALVLIMSVFNGFEEVILSLENALTPDVKIRPVEGKVFSIDEARIARLDKLKGVRASSLVLEELVLFEYGDDRQEVAMIKGVEDSYRTVTDIDSLVIYGSYLLEDEQLQYGVPSTSLVYKLGINMYDALTPLQVYVPRTGPSRPMQNPFRTAVLYPSAAYSVLQEGDYGYVIASLDFVQRLLNTNNKASFIEVKLEDGVGFEDVLNDIQEIFGSAYNIESKDSQNADLQKIIRLEKWMGYAILCLAIILVALNLIGTLWMIVLDKKSDIAVLRALGSTDRQIRKIFVAEGVFICLLGLVIGLVIAMLIYSLQQNLGIISIPEGYILDAYPMKLKAVDLFAAAAAVLIIGLLAILPPALSAHKVGLEIREE